jgi:hypothetical protein
MSHERYIIGLGTNNRFESRVVRAVTGGWCSHAWLEYCSMRFGGIWVIHSTGKRGVVRERFMEVWKRYPVRKRYEVNWDLSDGLVTAINALKSPYDMQTTLVNSALLFLHRYLGYTAKNIARNSSLFNCSELITTVLKDSKIPNSEQFDPEATTPIMLDQICASGDGLFKEL